MRNSEEFLFASKTIFSFQKMTDSLFPNRPFKDVPSRFQCPTHCLDDPDDNFLEFDPPTQDFPANATEFEGVGIRFGWDRDGLVSLHGDDSDGFPIKRMERTKG